MKIYDNVSLGSACRECGREVLSAEDVWCHVALQESEVRAVEMLRGLNLIPHSTRLSLHIAYLRVSSAVLKALFRTEVHP